jgi:hypothetical protein
MGGLPKHVGNRERKCQIKRFSPRYEHLLRLLVEGKRVKDVAAATGFSREMISIIANSKIGHDYLAALDKYLFEEFLSGHWKRFQNAHNRGTEHKKG